MRHAWKGERTQRIYQCAAGTLLIYLVAFHHPDPWMAELMMSSTVLQLRARKDLTAAIGLSIPLFVLFCFLHWPALFAIPMALGSASLFALTVQNSCTLPDALIMPAGYLLVQYAHPVIVRVTPRTIDPSLAAIDLAFRLNATGFMLWSNLHPVARTFLVSVYNWLPLVAVFVMVYTDERKRYLLALFVAAILAVPCYLLFPAVGPAHLSDAYAPRNCMPSLHFAWAFLAFWYCPKTWRSWMGVFVWLIAIATIATGEHYFIDLCAAVPFIYVTQMIAGWLRATPKSLLPSPSRLPT